MADILDIFSGDAFGAASLTTTVNRMPYVPGFLAGLGLVPGEGKGIATTTAVVEFKNGRITLVPNAARGSREHVTRHAKRERVSFNVPHLPEAREILTGDIQNVVALGGNTLENMSTYIADNLAEMRTNQDLTHEFHRVGMVSGKILDADATTTIIDFFTEFGATEVVVDVNTATAGAVRTFADAVVKNVSDELGGAPATRVVALLGDTMFDNFVNSADVRDSYDKTEKFDQTSYVYRSFFWRGVTWVDYRGTVGGTPFIAAAEGRAFPVGPGLYERFNAPADYMSTANRLGLPMYSSQERMKHDKGIELEVQSNPLFLPTRIQANLKLTDSTP